MLVPELKYNLKGKPRITLNFVPLPLKLPIFLLFKYDFCHVPLLHTLAQIISAAQTLALHPSSKIAKENLDVFCEAWESQLCDMALLLREINDVFEGRRGPFYFN